MRRLPHGGSGSAEGRGRRRGDAGGGRRDGGPAGKALRGDAGGHGRLKHPAEEPLGPGAPQGEGERTGPII